jgi:hypothetical protein
MGSAWDDDAITTDNLTIDCDECVMQHSDACADCVVTFLCGPDEAGRRGPLGSAVVIDVAEQRALRLLADSGLVPPLRLRRPAS